MSVTSVSSPSTARTEPVPCPQCESLRQAPVAASACEALLEHVQGADYFELFGLPRVFEVDAAALESRYLAISRNIHPDRFATAEAVMQSFALRSSAAVNRAYDVLRDDLRRAEYLLETAGGKSVAEDKRVAPELLAEVMRRREEIDEARANGDRAALAAMRGQVDAKRQAALGRVRGLCAALAGGDEAAREALRAELNGLKYYENLLRQLQ